VTIFCSGLWHLCIVICKQCSKVAIVVNKEGVVYPNDITNIGKQVIQNFSINLFFSLSNYKLQFVFRRP